LLHFQEKSNFKIKLTKIQNGGQKSKWGRMVLFQSKKRIERYLSGKLLTIFGCNSAENQHGVNIQNGAKN
jgi:hypothetical protein